MQFLKYKHLLCKINEICDINESCAQTDSTDGERELGKKDNGTCIINRLGAIHQLRNAEG